MARPGVTYTEIASAAQQIAASGRFPTVEGVRLILGTGSNSTVGQHLRTWKMKQDSTQQIATKENIPEALIAAIKGVWEVVMTQSETAIQTIQDEASQTVSTNKQHLEQLQKSNNEWQQRYQQLKQKYDGLAHEKATLDHLLINEKLELATTAVKLANMEQKYEEKQMRVDELNRQNQQIQANLEHYRESSLAQRLEDQQRYEQQQNQLERTIQQLNQELVEAKRSSGILQQSHQHATFENDNLKIQLHKIENQYESQTTRLTDALGEVIKKTQDAEHWQNQFQALQIKYDEQNKNHMELKTQQAVSSQQLVKLQSELKEMRDQNSVLAHEKLVLGQEKAQLYGQFKQLESRV